MDITLGIGAFLFRAAVVAGLYFIGRVYMPLLTVYILVGSVVWLFGFHEPSTVPHYAFCAVFFGCVGLIMTKQDRGVHQFLCDWVAKVLNGTGDAVNKITDAAGKELAPHVQKFDDFMDGISASPRKPKSHAVPPDAYIHLGSSADSVRGVIAIPEKLFKERHLQIVGPTGSGKGVLLGQIGRQSIAKGHGLVILDPKRDRFLPHILADTCRELGKKLVILDLKAGSRGGGWHPFASGPVSERISRAILAMDLMPSGKESDFYRIEGKEAVTEALESTDGKLSSMVSYLEKSSSAKVAAKEKSLLRTWLRRAELNPSGDGFDLDAALDEGAVVLVRSDANDPELVVPLRSVFMQVMQWRFRHPVAEQGRHLTVIGDEVSLWVWPYLAQSLATVREAGANIVLAYQSMSDLESGFNNTQEGRIVRQRIDQNCQLKVFYGTQDNLTVDEITKMSGEQIKHRKTYEQRLILGSIHSHSTEEKDTFIQVNTVRELPERYAVYFQPAKKARILRTEPVKTEQKNDLTRYLVLPGQREAVAKGGKGAETAANKADSFDFVG